MECKDYHDLLIQLPYEELNPEERVLLESHLKNCDKCSAELEKNQQLFEFTRKLKNSIPKDENKENTIFSVLEEINVTQKIRRQQIISYQTLRIIINAAAVFLLGLFLIQQMEMKKNLESLNTKFESQANANSQNNKTENIEITSFIEDPNLLEHFGLSEDEVLDIIKNYKNIRDENSDIFHYLRTNYPEVYENLQKKLKEGKPPTQKL